MADTYIDEIIIDTPKNENKTLFTHQQGIRGIAPVSIEGSSAMYLFKIGVKNTSKSFKSVWVGMSIKYRPQSNEATNMDDSTNDTIFEKNIHGMGTETRIKITPGEVGWAYIPMKLPSFYELGKLYLRASLWPMKPGTPGVERFDDFPGKEYNYWVLIGENAGAINYVKAADNSYERGAMVNTPLRVQFEAQRLSVYTTGAGTRKSRVSIGKKMEVMYAHHSQLDAGSRNFPTLHIKKIVLGGVQLIQGAPFNQNSTFPIPTKDKVVVNEGDKVRLRIYTRNLTNSLDVFRCYVSENGSGAYDSDWVILPHNMDAELNGNKDAIFEHYIRVDQPKNLYIKFESLLDKTSGQTKAEIFDFNTANILPQGQHIIEMKPKPPPDPKYPKLTDIRFKPIGDSWKGANDIIELKAKHQYEMGYTLGAEPYYGCKIAVDLKFSIDGNVVDIVKFRRVVPKHNNPTKEAFSFTAPTLDDWMAQYGDNVSVGYTVKLTPVNDAGQVFPGSTMKYVNEFTKLPGVSYKSDYTPGEVVVGTISLSSQDYGRVQSFPTTDKLIKLPAGAEIFPEYELKNTDTVKSKKVVCKLIGSYSGRQVMEYTMNVTVPAGNSGTIYRADGVRIPDNIDGRINTRMWVQDESGKVIGGNTSSIPTIASEIPKPVSPTAQPPPYIEKILFSTPEKSATICQDGKAIIPNVEVATRPGDKGWNPLGWTLHTTVRNPGNSEKLAKVWMDLYYVGENDKTKGHTAVVFDNDHGGAYLLSPDEAFTDSRQMDMGAQKFKSVAAIFRLVVEGKEVMQTDMINPLAIYTPEPKIVVAPPVNSEPGDEPTVPTPNPNDPVVSPPGPEPVSIQAVLGWSDIDGRGPGNAIEVGDKIGFYLRVINESNVAFSEQKCRARFIVQSKNGELLNETIEFAMGKDDAVDVHAVWTPSEKDLSPDDDRPIALFVMGYLIMEAGGKVVTLNTGELSTFGYLIPPGVEVYEDELEPVDIEEPDLIETKKAVKRGKTKERPYFILPDFGPFPELRITATIPLPKIERV